MVGITIGMEEKEHRIIKQRAKRNRQTLSQYMIFCALEGAELLELRRENALGVDAPAGIRTPFDLPFFKIREDFLKPVIFNSKSPSIFL